MSVNLQNVNLQSVSLSSTSVPVDPYFSSVQLLAHFDGANDSTVFTDSSASPKTMSETGGCVISTVQSVFGGASMRSPNVSNARVVTQNAGCRIFGDFTIEFRLRMISTAAAQYFLISNYVVGSSWIWFNTAANNKLSCYITGDSMPDTSISISPDTWYAIALTRNGTVRRLFIDGVIASTDSGSVAVDQALDTGWSIGGPGPSMASGSGNCYIDELRITNGVARYTSAYTPATSAFPNA